MRVTPLQKLDSRAAQLVVWGNMDQAHQLRVSVSVSLDGNQNTPLAAQSRMKTRRGKIKKGKGIDVPDLIPMPAARWFEEPI
jgi:hypothetical protein